VGVLLGAVASVGCLYRVYPSCLHWSEGAVRLAQGPPALGRHLLMVGVLHLQRAGPTEPIKRDTQVVPRVDRQLLLVNDVLWSRRRPRVFTSGL
jgi:hypothetical protein